MMVHICFKVFANFNILPQLIYRTDLSILPLDTVEQLQRFVPNDNEAKAFKQYEKDKKPIDKLTEEDKLMMQV